MFNRDATCTGIYRLNMTMLQYLGPPFLDPLQYLQLNCIRPSFVVCRRLYNLGPIFSGPWLHHHPLPGTKESISNAGPHRHK